MARVEASSPPLLVGDIDFGTIVCLDMLPVPGAVFRLKDDLCIAALKLLPARRTLGCAARRRVAWIRLRPDIPQPIGPTAIVSANVICEMQGRAFFIHDQSISWRFATSQTLCKCGGLSVRQQAFVFCRSLGKAGQSVLSVSPLHGRFTCRSRPMDRRHAKVLARPYDRMICGHWLSCHSNRHLKRGGQRSPPRDQLALGSPSRSLRISVCQTAQSPWAVFFVELYLLIREWIEGAIADEVCGTATVSEGRCTQPTAIIRDTLSDRQSFFLVAIERFGEVLGGQQRFS